MCDCSKGKKDQTKEAVFDYVETKKLQIMESSSSVMGIGIFLVPAPEIGILEQKAVYVEDLNYVETVKRGTNCIAFQWVPKGMGVKIKSGKNIKISSVKELEVVILSCSDNRCKASGCPMGCFCYSTDTGNCRTN